MKEKEIAEYLGKYNLKYEDIFFCGISDDYGIVSPGNISEILINTPRVGESADLSMPFLHGVLPLKGNIVLPNIQVWPNKYFDIHLVKTNESNWLIAKETTEKVVRYRNEIEVLNSNRGKNDDICSSHPKLLNYLGYVVLKREQEVGYRLPEVLPAWFKSIVPEAKEKEILDIDKNIPFLESFLSNLTDFWNGEAYKQKRADLWSEQSINGEEINLTAMAFNCKNGGLLLIYPINYDTGYSRQLLMQKARESALNIEKLEEAEHRMKELVELKEQFVSIISHDYRSPLSTIISGISFLLEDTDFLDALGEDQLAMIMHIKDEISHMLEYNSKIYTWTQLNMESFQMNFSNVSASMLAKSVSEQFDMRFKEKSINFEIDIKDDFFVKVDHVLFIQAIANLVDNAIKFTPRGGKIMFVAGDKKIQIIDSGTGMPGSVIKKILNGEYFKSGRGTDGEKGTGIGLGIAKKIIDAHMFSLDLESEQGTGSKFIISTN